MSVATDKKTRLTPQQEKFAQGVASGKSQAEAYREAYPRSKKWDQDAVYSNASTMASDTKVLQRIDELRKPIVARVRYDLEKAMTEAQEGMQLARSLENPSAFVSAVTLRSKLNGLLVDRHMAVPHILDGLTHEEVRALHDALAAKVREIDVTPKPAELPAPDTKR